ETIKDAWRVVTGLGKQFIGTVIDGVVHLTIISKAIAAAVAAPFQGKNPLTAFTDSFIASEQKLKARADELRGQKLGDPGYAKPKEDPEVKRAAKEAEQARERHMDRMLKLEEDLRKKKEDAALAEMTSAEKVAELK